MNTLTEEYLKYTKTCMEGLDSNFKNLVSNSDDFENSLENIKIISHDIKGMGGSFGYDLMSEIGASINTYLRNLSASGLANIEIIKNHIEALHHVLENDIKGFGGDEEKKILAQLKASTNTDIK